MRRSVPLLLLAAVAVAGTGCTASTAGLGDQPSAEMSTLSVPSRWLPGAGYRVEAIDGEMIIGTMLVRYQLPPSDHVVTVVRIGDLPGAPERVDLALRTVAGGIYQLRTAPVAGGPSTPAGSAPPVAIYDTRSGQVVSHAVGAPAPAPGTRLAS